MKSLRILNLSTFDYGGAGNAAVRIHNALLDTNHDSVLIVKHKRNNQYSNVYELRKRNIFSRIYRGIRSVLLKLLFSNKYLMYGVMPCPEAGIINELKELKFIPDVIIIHWVSNFVDTSEITKIAKLHNCKIVYYFMDMANFTGGCHFSWDCIGYQSDCKDCPADKFNIGLPNINLNIKIDASRDYGAMAIAPNSFVADQVKKSRVFDDCVVSYIPIDYKVFRPKVSNSMYKASINLLFGSADLKGGRKGGDLLINMLRIFDELWHEKLCVRNVIVTIPGLQGDSEVNGRHFSIRGIPIAMCDVELAELYRNVDFFICCSREDSGPLMVSESLMCGTPVLAFNVGICTELIEEDFNGYVVKNHDCSLMAKKLIDIVKMKDAELNQLKINSRNSALDKLSPTKFGQKLNTIFL